MKFRFYALKLCLICIVVYLLQLIIPGFTELFILNSNFPSQYWRYLTAIFLHGGLAHLVFNLFALALFGSILEKLIRGRKFLFIFFLSGILVNIVSINFYESSLGASGAIYGILGVLMIIAPLMFVWAFGLPMPMFIAGILWIIGEILGLFIPSNIGHIAHLSGLAIGILIGVILRVKKKTRKIRREKIQFSNEYVRLWEDNYLNSNKDF
jgi:hypothetical protein